MNLPDEVMLHIMSFLDAADLCEVSLACNHWNLLSNEAVLWRGLCTKYSFLPQNYEGQKWNQETTGYKQLFLCPCCFNLRRLNSNLNNNFSLGYWKEMYKSSAKNPWADAVKQITTQKHRIFSLLVRPCYHRVLVLGLAGLSMFHRLYYFVTKRSLYFPGDPTSEYTSLLFSQSAVHKMGEYFTLNPSNLLHLSSNIPAHRK